MNELSKTLFIPFYFKYKESIGEKAIYDYEAVKFFSSKESLNIANFKEMEKDKNSYTGIIARTVIIDKYIKNIINDEQIENVYNIGCGLDFRNRRLEIDISWYNIDLKEVIDYRNKLFSVREKEINLEGDILDTKNWSFISSGVNIFVLEGILMYFKKEDVIEIIKNLASKCKKSYFIIESCPEEMAEMSNKSVSSIDSNISFKWGVNNIENFAKELEIECIESQKIMDYFTERWDDSLMGGMKDSFKNNFKISLFKSRV